MVGTSSLRRVVQLLALRPDLVVRPLRGNLDTRLRKLDEGGYDGIVLAAAGLMRLGLGDRIAMRFEADTMLPCAGQGALGIEVRSEASALRAQLAGLTDRPTWLAAQAERAVSRALGGSCSLPLAAYGTWSGATLDLRVALGHALRPGAPLLRAEIQRVRRVGRRRPGARGAGRVAVAHRRCRGLPPGCEHSQHARMKAPLPFTGTRSLRVIVTRPAAQAATWVERLQARGIDAVAVPLIDIAQAADPTAVDAAWAGLAGRRLVFFVSPNAVERFFARRPEGASWPADVLAGSPGPGTTLALVEQGVPASCLRAPPDDAPSFDSEALWASLQHLSWQGASVLIVRGDGGREAFAQTLRAAGARVDLLSAYRRLPPALDVATRTLLEAALARPAEHLWLFSSSEANRPPGFWDWRPAPTMRPPVRSPPTRASPRGPGNWGSRA